MLSFIKPKIGELMGLNQWLFVQGQILYTTQTQRGEPYYEFQFFNCQQKYWGAVQSRQNKDIIRKQRRDAIQLLLFTRTWWNTEHVAKLYKLVRSKF